MEPRNETEVLASSSWTLLDSILPVSENDDPNLTLSLSKSTSVVKLADGMKKEFGRYVASEVLGEGGYGRVFKAYDHQLQRHVAVKVPHIYRLSTSDSVQKYLDEARTVAKLDHPGIVAVHDVGVTDDGLPYIVSAYIDGISLAMQMHQSPLSLRRGLRLLVDVATALQYVHSQDIVHRDIKPGNILLNQDGKPFLADFGLALRDEANESIGSRVGTPAYMSPEQARGESHLVDGRSDLFSVGVVLYEMLTGKRPFRGSDRESVIQSLLSQDPRPPRQHNAGLPRDLERICLKALAKRASHRYSTAADIIEDIEHFLITCDGEATSQIANPGTDATTLPTPQSEHDAGVVPRGLRSYDRHDAGFFSRLLPGPRDRQWVPESLRFWQRQIENRDTNDPLRVGVLYGPSGCGKSSFVKAGLLPLLDSSISTVFVEATAGDTEARLLRGIRRRCPDAQPNAGLTETLTQIRQENESSENHRLLIVIDQFEQWLHGRSDDVDPELANALRQCDGYSVQCLLLVRDDFWLALSRFMGVLDIPLKQNHNAALVDLFSTAHARKVIAELGMAYDCLPSDAKDYTADQIAFVRQSAEQLSEGGKVFPVRLTLFVEMVKQQEWTPSTLSNMGGVHGIGLRFLEESFSSDLAPIAQRTHEPAVRQVLRKLLPEQGVDIKGNMQSEDALREASGYREQPAAFAQVMRVLDTDLRLVTPTDPSGTTTSDDSYSQSGDGVRYYQLTHDYLVPAIEDWLTRRQRETRRGRAELRLAEYASVWSAKPFSKYAPSWIDWATISIWSPKRHWSRVERMMMRSATKRYLVQSVCLLCIASLILVGTLVMRNRSQAIALVEQLQTARTADLPDLLNQVSQTTSFVIPALTENAKASPEGSRRDLVNRLGLLQHDASGASELVTASLDADLPMVLLIRDEVKPIGESVSKSLVTKLQDPASSGPHRLRAAVMLAASNMTSSTLGEWFTSDDASTLVEDLLQHARVAPQDHAWLVEGFRPFSQELIAPLRAIALHPDDSQRRVTATSLLTSFLVDDPESLLTFFLDADQLQHASILPTLDPILPSLSTRVREIAFVEIDTALPESEFDRLARRKGTAAALLHRQGAADLTWTLMAHSPYPNVRSYLTHRVAPLGGDYETILNRLARETHPSIRRALLITLGNFRWSAVPDTLKLQMIALAKDAFTNDPDIGIHSASEWLLLKIGQEDWVRETTIKSASLEPDPRKNWYVNKEKQTMAILDARDVPEVGRVFAISTKEVSVEQYLQFDPMHDYFQHRSPTDDCPIGMLDWYDCLEYCRWLSKRMGADAEYSYPEALSELDPQVGYSDVTNHGAYRLPTAAEWIYACAALTKTRRYYGLTDSLGDHYYWHYDTSLADDRKVRYYPGGTKEPNDFGMFAMYDGVREWVNDHRGDRCVVMGLSSTLAPEQPETIPEQLPADLPAANNGFYGLRVARTIVASQ
ncbi:MAG: protein kinase [Pirellulaceae bacterium]